MDTMIPYLHEIYPQQMNGSSCKCFMVRWSRRSDLGGIILRGEAMEWKPFHIYDEEQPGKRRGYFWEIVKVPINCCKSKP